MANLASLSTAVALVVAAGACSPGSENVGYEARPADPAGNAQQQPADRTPSEPILVTYQATSGGVSHAIAATGALVLDRGCFYLEAPGLRVLLMLPRQGTRWDAANQTLVTGNHAFRIGARLEVSGDAVNGSPELGDGQAGRCDYGRVFIVTPGSARPAD